jgi:hypothetical protein
MKDLNKPGVLILLIAIVFIIGIIYFPYMHVTVSGKVNGFSVYNNFIVRDWLMDMVTIPFWCFVLLVLESTVVKKT